MIVVFDSGIWVSAMEFGGTPLEAVIRAIAQDRFAGSPCATKLRRRLCGADPQVRLGGGAGSRRLGFLLDGRLARGAERNRYRHLPRPKDEPILECAERAEAKCIVTGDNDLLSLASYRGIRIMTARDYFEGR